MKISDLRELAEFVMYETKPDLEKNANLGAEPSYAILPELLYQILEKADTPRKQEEEKPNLEACIQAVKLNENGPMDEFERELKQSMAEFERAIKRTIEESNSRDYLAQFCEGCDYDKQGKLDDAVRCYRKAIEFCPNDSVICAFMHASLGAALSDQGKFDDAVLAYRKVIELRPNDAVALHNLGLVFERQGRLDDAKRCYQRAILFKPRLGVAHFRLGLVFERQGKPDYAVPCYKKAIELGLKFPIEYYHLGLVLSKKGKKNEAIKYYKVAAMLGNKDAEKMLAELKVRK